MHINIKLKQGDNEVYIESDDVKEILENLDNIKKVVNNVATISFEEIANHIAIEPQPTVLTPRAYAPAELINKSGASTLNDKLIVLVYYLWKYKKMDSVNTDDLREAFKEIMEPPPRNITSFMNYITSKGMVMITAKKDNMKAWRVTNSGVKFVEGRLYKHTSQEKE